MNRRLIVLLKPKGALRRKLNVYKSSVVMLQEARQAERDNIREIWATTDQSISWRIWQIRKAFQERLETNLNSVATRKRLELRKQPCECHPGCGHRQSRNVIWPDKQDGKPPPASA